MRPLLPVQSGHIALVYPQPFSHRFQNADEHRYFQLYYNDIVYRLAGFWDPALWNRIILQASEAHDFVRHAVIAIGALDMTNARPLETRPDVAKRQMYPLQAACKGTSPTGKAETPRVFALQQYTKAIKKMRKMMKSGKEDLRTILIASILIVCFENYYGNYKSATWQIRSAIKLIEDRKTRQKCQKHIPLPTNRLQELCVVEDDIISTFDRLDSQTTWFYDGFSLDEHLQLKDAGSEIMATMPSTFSMVSESRPYFNFIIRKVTHLKCIVSRCEQNYLGTQNNSPENLYFGPQFSQTLFLTKQSCLMEAERWMAAFRPLYKEAQQRARQRDFFVPAVLRAHYLTMCIVLENLMKAEELAYDESLEYFIEIVELSECLLKGDDSYFTFDLKTVWLLDNVAKKCRHPIVRRNAIRLLRLRPRREGIWDSVIAANVCEWIMEIEEEGMIDGSIPETSRARNVEMKIDLENQKVEVWCQFPETEGRRMRRRETSIWLYQS